MRASIVGWRPGLPVPKTKPAQKSATERIHKNDLVKGLRYSRRQIHEALGGPLQEYLPHVNNRVVCVCVTRQHNPDAPSVILPSDGPRIMHWAKVFAQQNWPVPVFIKERDGEWLYAGDYQSWRLDTSYERVTEHRARARRADIPFVLLLRPAKDSASTE